jgi:hypothetical protein
MITGLREITSKATAAKGNARFSYRPCAHL